MIEAAVTKVIKKVTPKNEVLKKVIPKDEALKNKSRSDKSGKGCVLAQNLTPEGESTEQPIKIDIGGTSAQSKQGKTMAKLRSRRSTLDWWKCYPDSCASYHTFFVREFLENIKEDGSTMDGNCNAGSVLLKEKG